MAAKLRVLIVEDSQDDAALLVRALRRGAWEVIHERVETPAAMSAALDTGQWDLIIADFSMPQFSGPAALALAQERGSDVPFILISGVVGEEIAVEAMKAGADDYVAKSNLKRLVAVVERELYEANERNAAREIEQQLRKRETQLADALQRAKVGTWHLDVSTNTSVWSDEACRIIGFKTGQPVPSFDDLLARLHPEDSEVLAELLRNPKTHDFSEDFRILRPDGSTQFVNICGDITRDKYVMPLEAAGTIQDVSDRKKAEEALRASEGRHRTLFEYAPDGILIADTQSRYLDANPSICKMLGYSSSELIGLQASDIVCKTEAPNIQQALDEIYARSEHKREWQFMRKDGSVFVAEVSATMMPDGNVMGVIRDITERKLAENEICRVKELAEAANRAKSEFLANMSHEIRTPMTAIIGFSDMMLQPNQDPSDRAKCVQTVRRNAMHLLELINDILDLSKIEAGRMTVERISCDLTKLFADLISLMRPRAMEKGLQFDVSFDGRIPRIIKTDPMRLRQILVNLLGNAVKFTAEGRIHVRVKSEECAARQVLGVEVIDTGIGLDQQQIGRLFHPFTQAEESTTRKFGGTGLGLTISQQLAHLLGGQITIQSEPGVGSVFTLNIDGGPSADMEMLKDFEQSMQPKAAAPEAWHSIPLRGQILLVEDGRDNQRLLSLHLRDSGAEVTIAENGLLGIEQAAKKSFDMILMDMQMPVMDGYTATAELRRKGFTKPIIAMTAYAMAEDRKKCLACGCDDYLSKPIDREHFLMTVSKYLGQAQLATPCESSALAKENPSIKTPGLIKSSLADKPSMKKIIAEFIDELPAQVWTMTDLLQRNDLDALRRVVHQIRGASGGYGFSPVTEPATKTEQALRESKSLDIITENINSLIETLRQIDGFDPSKERPQEETHPSPTSPSAVISRAKR